MHDRRRVAARFTTLTAVWCLLASVGPTLPAVSASHLDDETADEASAATEWRPGPSVDLGSVGTGALLWKSRRGLIPLPMLETDVELEVTGIVVHGTVTQRFNNPTDVVIEALYVFPLPDKAAVSHMEMRIGPRRIFAVIQERREAKRTYAQARREGKKAALVEQERPNLFTTSAANINPGETIEVVLEYLEEVSYDEGVFSLRFPLTFTPRYVPLSMLPQRLESALPTLGSAGSGVLKQAFGLGDAERINPPFAPAAHPAAPRAKLRARINAGIPLEEVDSGSHAIRTFLDGEVWEVEPEVGQVRADRDFQLRWRPLLDDRPETAMFIEERPEGRYALLMLVPPDPSAVGDWGLPIETLFVIDVSGSMAGPSIEQARQALLAALDRLRPEDTFNIFKFNNDTVAFSPQFEFADPSNLERARSWVRGLSAGGGTEIYPAMLRALAMIGRSRSDRVQRLIFLTDGAVGNEDQVFQAIVEGLGRARLHTIGIGHAPNTYLMRKMAAFGRGVCRFISTHSDAANKIDEFFTRIDRPLMSDVALQWEGMAPQEIYPERLPDLYPEEPLMVSFRLGEGSTDGRVVLSGRLREGGVDTDFSIATNAAAGSGIAVRWAREKVRTLMDGLYEGADPAMVRKEVVHVGLAFNLVTKYTSLVAVEEFASATGEAKSVRLPNALPHGSQLGGVILPQGGTWQPLISLLAVLLIVAGSLLLLTTVRWRLL